MTPLARAAAINVWATFAWKERLSELEGDLRRRGVRHFCFVCYAKRVIFLLSWVELCTIAYCVLSLW
jgi:hypothetical protein